MSIDESLDTIFDKANRKTLLFWSTFTGTILGVGGHYLIDSGFGVILGLIIGIILGFVCAIYFRVILF